MQTVFCKHIQNDFCLSKTNLVVQTVKLLLPSLDLAWHKYKVIILGACSEERPEVVWKGGMSCSQWHTAREEKSDSVVFPP